MNKDDLLQDAVNTFGKFNQILKAIEEYGEYIVELSRYLQGDGNAEHIAEEQADVLIVTAQMPIIFDNSEEVEQYVDFKSKRLGRTIEKEKMSKE